MTLRLSAIAIALSLVMLLIALGCDHGSAIPEALPDDIEDASGDPGPDIHQEGVTPYVKLRTTPAGR